MSFYSKEVEFFKYVSALFKAEKELVMDEKEKKLVSYECIKDKYMQLVRKGGFN